MKQLFIILLFPVLLIAGSLDQQTARLSKILWENQKQFKLTEIWVDVKVKHSKDMKCTYCWGDEYNDESGSHIEVMAKEDFPPSFPQGKRDKFQNEILQHEVLHIVMTRLGVPDQAQDGIIEGLRPAMQQHMSVK